MLLYSVLSTRLREPWAQILASLLDVRGWYPTQILFFSRLIPHLNVQCPIIPFVFRKESLDVLYFSSVYSPTQGSLQICFQSNWGVMICHAGNFSQICIPFNPYIALILPIFQIMSSPALCTYEYKCLFSYSLGDQCFKHMITNVFIFFLQLWSPVLCTHDCKCFPLFLAHMNTCLFFLQPWGPVLCVRDNKCFYFLQLLFPVVDANDKKMFFCFFSLQRYPV